MSDIQQPTTTDERTPVSLVYAGRRVVNGKVRYVWISGIETNDGRLSGKELYYAKRLIHVSVGVCVIFPSKRTENGLTIWGSDGVVNGPVSGFKEQVLEWESADRAAGLEVRRIQEQKRLAKNQPQLEPILERLNRVYWKLPSAEREAFAAHVLFEIMKYTPPKALKRK